MKGRRIKAMAKKNVYLVWEGRQLGKFYSWGECEAQVKGYSGAKFKGFDNEKELEEFMSENGIVLVETENNRLESMEQVIASEPDREVVEVSHCSKKGVEVRPQGLRDTGSGVEGCPW